VTCCLLKLALPAGVSLLSPLHWSGYYANVTRMSPDAHPGVLNLIIKEFIDK